MSTTATLPGRALTESRLLWLTLCLILAWQVGAHVDAWYHIHYGFAIESFFTWPHALLYAAWAGTGLVVAFYLLESRRRREPRGAWLPPGYPVVLFGVILFGLGGGFDLVWHTLFGFEADLETLLAPSHLWLVVSFMVAALGLFRAGLEWRARMGASAYRPRWADLPALLGLAILFRITLWSFFYSEPLANDYASGGALTRHLPSYGEVAWDNIAAQVAGTTGIMLHSILLTLFLVVPLRRLRLPGGTISTIMLWEGLLVVGSTDLWVYLPAVAGAAFAGEGIWAWLWRGGLGGIESEAGYWLLAFVVPVVQFFLYFALMGAAGGGIAWTTHLWAGSAVMAGVYGLITSLFAVPPRFIHAALPPRRT